jgi:hypothetical protein
MEKFFRWAHQDKAQVMFHHYLSIDQTMQMKPPLFVHRIRQACLGENDPGFDIYRIPHGATIHDTETNTKGVMKTVYTYPASEPNIVMTPSDFSIPDYHVENSRFL